MKISLALLLALASALVLSASGAEAASFKNCGSTQVYGSKAKYQAKGLTCTAARKVLKSAGIGLCFDNSIPGWTKVWRPLPNGGKALTLKKGAKAIKTNACSPK